MYTPTQNNDYIVNIATIVIRLVIIDSNSKKYELRNTNYELQITNCTQARTAERYNLLSHPALASAILVHRPQYYTGRYYTFPGIPPL